MKMIVKCGEESCRKEFNADTDEPEWICPYCERVIQNKNYPFLTVKLMEALSRPHEADWQELHKELLENAAKLVKEKDEEIEKLKAEIKKLKKK